MTKVVRLKFLAIPSSKGFQVPLRIKGQDTEADLNGTLFQTVGFLPPPPPSLRSALEHWKSYYDDLTDVRKGIDSAGNLRISPKPGVTNYSNYAQSEGLVVELNKWLNDMGDRKWRSIKQQLAANGSNRRSQHPNDEIRVFIETNDPILRRLPWQEWDLFRDFYPYSEVAINAFVEKTIPLKKNERSQVRLLVAVGRSDGIETDFDIKVIEQLQKQGHDVTILMQPSPEVLCRELRSEKGYQVFIFAGHSAVREDGMGTIELNETERIAIPKFRDALTRAMDNGLQLAIFNCCDGLRLTQAEGRFALPVSIVMREPVPDRVAHYFLKQFFAEFTAGKSLFSSVREARERLEHWNLIYPGAQWLPIICINPSLEPPSWASMGGENVESQREEVGENLEKQKKSLLELLMVGAIGAILGGAIALGGFFLFKAITDNSPQEQSFNYADGDRVANVNNGAVEKN